MAKDTLVDMVHDGSLVTDEEVDRMWEFSRYPGSMDAMFLENLGWFGTTSSLKKLKKLQQVLC